jgi:ferric-dicitrate binding protein FerR (iron transport regulator)
MDSLGHNTSDFDETSYDLPVAKVTSKRNWLLLSAAACLMIAMGTWFLFHQTQPTSFANTDLPTNQIVTKSGDRSKKILPDGTQVWLNAESKLEYNEGYGKTNRDIFLSGEAYFDVANKIHIKVTGTAFNVKVYPGEKIAETSLIRGKVEVTINARPDEKYILKPNEKLIVRDEDIAAANIKVAGVANIQKQTEEPLIQLGYIKFSNEDSAAIETSWVYNRLVFDDESFNEIARQMQRWYGVNIQIADSTIAAQHMTYTIRNETITQALRNMQYALHFHYTINKADITITK